MKLSTPKNITFYIAVALGIVGLVLYFFSPIYAFWVVFVGLVLLVLGNLLNGL